MFFWTVFETAIWASSAPLWYLFWTIYYLTTFRDLSTNCSEFWGKNFGTIVKLPSMCTDEYFEERMLFANKVQLLFGSWTLGLIKRTFPGKKIRNGFQNWLLLVQKVNLREKGSRIKQNFSWFFLGFDPQFFRYVCQNRTLIVQTIIL